MNSFGHAVMAAEIHQERGFMLGAILPDLLGFLPLKPPAILRDSVHSGIDHHKSVDTHFHSLSTFQQGMLAVSPELQALHVRRGLSRAAAHVGLEFYVDGYLARHEPAVTRWTTFLDAVLAQGISDLIAFSEDQEADTVLEFFQRQRRHPRPSTDPAVIAHRVARALGYRPRLKMAPQEVPVVEEALRAVGDDMSQRAECILAELRLTFRYGHQRVDRR
ncbi:MAG TPA: hypothetical protein PKA37_11755 [Planctomycetota bacterium]|nr:hypothetical protein [Planctomycetota bacterium]